MERQEETETEMMGAEPLALLQMETMSGREAPWALTNGTWGTPGLARVSTPTCSAR